MDEWKKPACGAKTRTGAPCRNTRIYTNGRCKNHGGLSTGPRTKEGRARALANLKGVDVKAVQVRDCQQFADGPRTRTHVKGSGFLWPGAYDEEPKIPDRDVSRWFNR